MTHLAVRSTVAVRGNRMMESLADFEVGDAGETLVAMNVRAEIEYKSDVIGTMPECCEFFVIETGANHRALVSSGNVTGWISTQTDQTQALTKKLKSGTGELPIYVANVQLSMREDMEFRSAVLMTLPEGSQFKLIENGPQNRAKIFVVDEDDEASIGWITAKTELDQPLIKALDDSGSMKRMKNLDTYVAKQLTKSEVKRVMSYGAAPLGERAMGKVKSTGSNAGGGPQPKGAEKEKAPPPTLSKCAWCCGS
jgi:hypothetical protein